MSADLQRTTARRSKAVLASYLGPKNRVVRSSPEAVAAVNAALGDDGLGRDRVLDVVVAWDGVLPALAKDISVVLESGVEHPVGSVPLPLGYHTLVRRGMVIGTVIAAPRFAPAATPGRWGVFLPLYALRRHRDTSLATYGDLDQLFHWLHERGGDTLLTLPLLPMYLDDPADWSPYSPVSRRMWNELYLDLDEFGAPVGDDAPRPVDDLLDYPALYRSHLRRLDAVRDVLWLDPAVQRFAGEHPLIAKYAAYRGAQAKLGRNWRTWKTTPGVLPATRHIDHDVERRHLVAAYLCERQIGAVADAATRRGQSLALDVAIGAHSDGFDVWNEGDLFVHSVSVGAPPDTVFVGGQNWGFPAVHPARSRATAHRYFRDTLRHHLRYAKLLRLDHVMGLFRQWWVPQGLPATDGAYVRYPLDELLAITCLEAALAGAVVVGENLGIVPPEVDEGLAEHHLLGIHVAADVLADYGTDKSISSTADQVAMLSTHDGVPFGGWWEGVDVERAHRHGLIDDATRTRRLTRRVDERRGVVERLAGGGWLHDPHSVGATMVATVEQIAAQDAAICIFNLEDLWLESRPQNTPGTFQEEPNWRRTAAVTLDQLEHDPGIDETLRLVGAARRFAASRSAAR